MSDGTEDVSRPLTVYTVGHSNVPQETFVALLKQHRVDVLVDVRSIPFSKYVPHFNAEPLKAAVQAAGIKYLYLGRELGGRPADRACYDSAGRVDYALVAQGEAFREGIERVLRGARGFRVALMCNEENPAECHRRLLVGRVLSEKGVRVLHIRGDGRLQGEDELAAAEQPVGTNQQEFTFAAREGTEWKSTRSVLPARPPRDSSAR